MDPATLGAHFPIVFINHSLRFIVHTICAINQGTQQKCLMLWVVLVMGCLCWSYFLTSLKQLFRDNGLVFTLDPLGGGGSGAATVGLAIILLVFHITKIGSILE